MTPPHFRRGGTSPKRRRCQRSRSTLEDRTKPTVEVTLDLQLEAGCTATKTRSLSRWSHIQALMPASCEALNRQVWETLRQRRFRVPHLRNDRPARGRPRQYYVRISQVNSRNLTEPEPSDRVLIVEQGCFDPHRSGCYAPPTFDGRPGREGPCTYDDLTVGRSTQDRPVTHCRGAEASEGRREEARRVTQRRWDRAGRIDPAILLQ